MTLDALLLERIREGRRDLWRGVRGRLGTSLTLLILFVHVGFFGILWLLGAAWETGRHRDAALVVARVLLPGTAVLAALAVAVLDTLRALVVSGPLLRSLGDALLDRPLRTGTSPHLADQLAAFGSAHDLARAAQIGDLPLILFLARVVLGLDVKPLIQAAQTGLEGEGLIRELEQQARKRAAFLIRRLVACVWLSLGVAILAPFLIGWVLR